MGQNIFKEHVPQKGKVAPQSVAAAANVTSGWIAAADAPDFLVQINMGALGGGTVTPSFEQASDSGGTGAKALTTGADVTAIAVNDTQRTLQFASRVLDHANGFTYFRLKLANVGGTGALVSASIHAVKPRVVS